MNKMSIKKDDTVVVLSGKDKGKQGKVLEVMPKEGKVVVEKINVVSRHTKPRKQGDQGGIIQKEAPIYACKVQRVCPKCNKPTRPPTSSATARRSASARSAAPRSERGGVNQWLKMPNLKKKYQDEVAPALMQKFGYKSPMQIPRMEKIVVNVGCGEARDNAKVLDAVVSDLTTITGQKAVITKAKKSVANFKLREGMPIGAKVTLRGDKMWEFLDRLFNVALPRVRDFRGINPNSFDGRGNYALGVKEQLIFPEIEYDKIDKIRGMDIVICTTAQTDEEAKELLTPIGAPFATLRRRTTMAKKSMILKQQAEPKFSTRRYNRCKICGRPHAYLRDYGICRICFRELALQGPDPRRAEGFLVSCDGIA